MLKNKEYFPSEKKLENIQLLGGKISPA